MYGLKQYKKAAGRNGYISFDDFLLYQDTKNGAKKKIAEG
jgi:hypothetical protein